MLKERIESLEAQREELKPWSESRGIPFDDTERLLELANAYLLIRDTPPAGMYVLNMFCMRGSRLWGSRLHRACAV